jgi:hypothetical protein
MRAMQISLEYALLLLSIIFIDINFAFRTGASNPIPRDRIKQGGIMVKATGPQASYKRPYNAQIPVPSVKSDNPTQKTVEKVEAAKQLRVAMKTTTSCKKLLPLFDNMTDFYPL